MQYRDDVPWFSARTNSTVGVYGDVLYLLAGAAETSGPKGVSCEYILFVREGGREGGRRAHTNTYAHTFKYKRTYTCTSTFTMSKET
jgi:hypothetical protein